MIERAFERVPAERLYAATGIQTMPINTVFQLLADEGSAALEAAQRIALVPDLLALLAVRRARQRAHERLHHRPARRPQRRVGARADRAAGAAGAPVRRRSVEPGTELGPLLAHHELDAPVYAVASHDTASAFAAAPLRRARGDPLAAARGRCSGSSSGAGADRRSARRQPHQRARHRRHDPAAQERDGPVAASRSARAPGTPTSYDGAAPPRRARHRTFRCSTPTTSASCAAATCRRGSPRPASARPAARRRRRDRALDPRRRWPASTAWCWSGSRRVERPRHRTHPRDRRRRAQRAAVPADRRPARPRGARRPGRGDRARQRARAGARAPASSARSPTARGRRRVGRADVHEPSGDGDDLRTLPGRHRPADVEERAP